MKNSFICKIIVFVLFCGSFCAAHARESRKIEEMLDNHFIYAGASCYEDLDFKNLSEEKKLQLWKKGMKEVETESHTERGYKCKEMLTSYYYRTSKKDYRKAHYWANRGALKGSSLCMGVLADMYNNGEGVVQDEVESLKWTFLAAALGCSPSIKYVQFLCENSPGTYYDSTVNEGRRRAQEWQRAHPEVFASPE